MKIRLRKRSREIFAEKFLELANIGGGVLLFGQFVSEKKLSKEVVLAAAGVVIVLYIFSFWLLEGRQK